MAVEVTIVPENKIENVELIANYAFRFYKWKITLYNQNYVFLIYLYALKYKKAPFN